jgi:hypothetical protein
MTRQRGGGLDQRMPGKPFPEIAQQNSRHPRGASPARSQLRNAERSRRRCGTEGLIQSKTIAHRVERLAVALRRQQPINIRLGEAIGIPGVGPAITLSRTQR